MAIRLADHLRGNDEQLIQRLALGDALEVPREVTHAAYFRRVRSVERALVELNARGFTTTLTPGRFRSLVEASRLERLDADNPTRFTTMVYDVVREFGGEYDGWGAMLARAPYVSRLFPEEWRQTGGVAVLSFEGMPGQLVVRSRDLYRRLQSHDRRAHAQGTKIGEILLYQRPDASLPEMRQLVQQLLVQVASGESLR
jgi:hypothetical protein